MRENVAFVTGTAVAPLHGMHDRDSSALTYILPIKATVSQAEGELTEYLRLLSPLAEVIVVDGSAPELFERHAFAWSAMVRHVPPAPDLATPMGKVGGVLTGVRLASHERLVIADDDVRYDAPALERMSRELDDAHVVRPQNYFEPLPWHARWDTGRMLLNRLGGGDWPGTLGVRRSILRATGGYDGRAMFENLELVRTVRAAGGVEAVPLDLFVKRRPSTTRHFWSQRIRQAYDEIARLPRLVVQLVVLPAAIIGVASSGWRALAVGVLAIIVAAELGRRRANGATVFPFSAALLAPAWVAERAVCSWLAVGARVLLGGVPYRGTILRHAATPMRVLRDRFAPQVPLEQHAPPRRSA
ncbi:MAG TPA: glycosyltransferase family 2 protein [Gemmatimonadaceae bacterium]|nr:glycosyltransferase family 2 protein [Gemmatimonadaceae bacterium]